MKPVHFSAQSAISRRHFLRGTGVLLGLPLLDAMLPAHARAAQAKSLVPRRFFGICNNLGVLPDKFFPAANSAGRGYVLSPYLEVLKEFRNDFTVFSGVMHPDVDGGHPADVCFLTAAPHPASGGFRNTISLDQYIAERVGHLTRFPSLTLGVNVRGVTSLSITAAGVPIPCDTKPSEVFKKLFLGGSPEEVKAQQRSLALGRSIMDAVGGQTQNLKRAVGAKDRERLDQYFTGVRELEKRMAQSAEWEKKPRPVVDAKPPVDPMDSKEYMERLRLMYDMAQLAFATDSTRNITLMLDSVSSPAITVEGQPTSDGYHNLSHHGRNAQKLADLERIDREHMKLMAGLFGDLKSHKEGSETLLDRTMVVYGSNMGNANTHVTTNLPVLFAGGGFRHGQHLAFDRERNYPLPNLFVNVLQRFGIEADRFASSTGTMRGLEMASSD
jgi:hypothetical protein